MELIIVSGDKFCLVTVTMGAVPLTGTFFHPLVERLGTSHQFTHVRTIWGKVIRYGKYLFPGIVWSVLDRSKPFSVELFI